MIRATNNAIGLEVFREEEEIYFVSHFGREKAEIKVPIEIIEKSLRRKEEKKDWDWLRYENKESNLKLVIQIINGQEGYRYYKMARIFSEPPVNHCDLITISAKELKNELQKLLEK